MTDAHGRDPSGDVTFHPMPRQISLTAASEHTPPQTTDRPGEREERRVVHRHAVILDVTADDRAHIRAEFRERLVHPSPKFRLDRLQLRLNRVRIVRRKTVKPPLRVVAQLCVKPRKLKLSGLPWPRARRFVAA